MCLSPVAAEVLKRVHTTSAVEWNWLELPVEILPSEMPEQCKTVILALSQQDVQVRSVVVGGKSGSRDVVYPMPKGWTVG